MAEKKPPPVVRLSYSKGEQIIKEGDYGISIYRVFKGHLRTFRKSGDTIIPLATLKRGDVFGEMSFFISSFEPRSISAEAIDDVELEVWHPAQLTEEYKDMPVLLRNITKQVRNRLLRMNRILVELSTKKDTKLEEVLEEDKRRYFRKEVNQACTYGPVSHQSKVRLHGVIKDISPYGLSVQVVDEDILHIEHKPGDYLKVMFQLPSGSSINEVAKIQSIHESQGSGYFFLGLEFVNISNYASREIGFFMMS